MKQKISKIVQQLQRFCDGVQPFDLLPIVDQTVQWLSSDEAGLLIDADPYWPKWNNAWWQMLLLAELGLEHEIPKSVLDRVQQSAKNWWMSFFPLVESELPEKFDPYRNIACHCAVASFVALSLKMGVQPELHFDWMVWFKKYQLPDGGWNCDEAVYTNSRKSSLISTVAVLEAFLEYGYTKLTKEQQNIVDRGIKYLLDRNLVLNSAKNNIPDQEWKFTLFPRFYELDCLRALTCVIRWSKQTTAILDIYALEYVIEELSVQVLSSDKMTRKRVINQYEDQTLLQNKQGQWQWKTSGTKTFPLLDFVNQNQELADHYLSLEMLNNFKYLQDLFENQA